MITVKVLVISDIHGNSDALKTVLKSAEGYDAIWFLGDYVDYGPEPHVAVDIVRDLRPEVILMGNHDHAVAYNTDCRCASEIHELSVYTRLNISYRLLGEDQIRWLKGLNLKAMLTINGIRYYIVHGSPRSPLYGYLKQTLSPEELNYHLVLESPLVLSRLVDVDILVTGHTHIPADFNYNGLRIVNPGSTGQPRDGDPRASYGLLDTEIGEFRVFKVKYDVETVLGKLRALGIERRYYEWLAYIFLNGKLPSSQPTK